MKKEWLIFWLIMLTVVLNFLMCIRVMFTEQSGDSVWVMISFFAIFADVVILASMGLEILLRNGHDED